MGSSTRRRASSCRTPPTRLAWAAAATSTGTRTARSTPAARRSVTTRPAGRHIRRLPLQRPDVHLARRARTSRATIRSATSTTKGMIVQHILPFEANIPLDRNSMFGRASYDLSDNVSAYAQVMSVSSETRRYFTDSPAIGGWGLIAQHGNGIYAPSLNANGTTNAAYLPGGQYGLNCAPTGGCTKSQTFPVSAELAALLDSRPNPEADWSFNYGMDFGDFGAPGNLYRSIFSETRTNQVSFGLKGEIEGIDGTWDVIVSQGTAKLDLRLEGYASLTRVRTILGSPNFGYGFFAQGNCGTSGQRLLGRYRHVHERRAGLRQNHGAISQDCLDAMYVTLNHQSEMEQKFVEGNVQGHAFDMPAGEARFSAGVHSRTNSYYYIFDPSADGELVQRQPGGIPRRQHEGRDCRRRDLRRAVGAAAGTAKRAPEHLNLELGYRYSDYESPGRHRHVQGVGRLGHHRHAALPRRPPARDSGPEHRGAVPSRTRSRGRCRFGGEPCALNSQVAYGANPARNPQRRSGAGALLRDHRLGGAGRTTRRRSKPRSTRSYGCRSSTRRAIRK